MQANKLRPMRGWYWIVEGIALVRRAPMAVFSATSTIAMLSLLFGTVPLVGQTVLFLVLPVLEIGMFLICRSVSEELPIHPALLFAGFRMQLRALFTVGGLRLIGNMLALWLAVLVSGAGSLHLMDVAMSTQNLPPNFLFKYLSLLGWFFVLRLPVEMATWFAAPCIGLRGVKAVKALFFSFVACRRNFAALAVFMLLFSMLNGVVGTLVMAVLGGMGSVVATIALAVYVILSVGVFYAAFYRSAYDIFGEWPHPWTHEI